MMRVGIMLLFAFVATGCATTSVVRRIAAPDAAPSEAGPLIKACSSPQCAGMGFINPLQLPSPCVERECFSLDQGKRDRTHVFMINGLDPWYAANLNSLCAYWRSLGFHRCRCKQMFTAGGMREDIVELRKRDPEAKIVVAGYSSGANCARSLVNQLQKDGVEVDLLVYLGGDTVFNTPESKPKNARKVLNVMGHGLALTGYDLFFKGEEIDGAINHRVDARHFVLPSTREASEIILANFVDLWRSDGPHRSAVVTLGRPSPLTADR